jgi:hypothetical protein
MGHYLVLARRKSVPSHRRRSIRFSKPESHSVAGRDADYRNAYELTLLRNAAMYLPNFLDGFDRLVAFDAAGARQQRKRRPARRVA